MDWESFFMGVGALAFAYWCYRDVKGKYGVDDDNVPRLNWGRNWSWAIGGTLIGIICILKSVPTDVAIIIVLCLVLVLIIFLFRWLLKVFRRLFKVKNK